MEEITNCNQCFNFCRIEEVKCHRGEVLRERLEKEKVIDKGENKKMNLCKNIE